MEKIKIIGAMITCNTETCKYNEEHRCTKKIIIIKKKTCENYKKHPWRIQ